MVSRLLERKKRPLPLEAAPVSQREVRRQLNLAAGGLTGNTRDPVSSVTEDFHQTFDAIGRRRASALAEGYEEGERTPGQEKGPKQPDRVLRPGEPARPAGQTAEGRQNAGGGRRMPESGIPLERFSEMAFRRGTLSASVLGGTGRMMLVSCLKRFSGQAEGASAEDELIGTGSQTRNVPGHAPDKMLFRRGFVDGAVGIVVDTLRDARQTVNSMLDIARGSGELRGGVEGGALLKMYPFLDSSRERDMAAQYESRLRSCTDVQERAVLQNGLVHARAMLDRKASMKEEFINKLRQISDKAEQALEEFEAPGFAEEVWQEVTGQIPEPPEGGDTPPEDGVPPEEGPDEPEDGVPPEEGPDEPEDGNPPEDEPDEPEDGVPPEEGPDEPEDGVPPEEGPDEPEDGNPPEEGPNNPSDGGEA